MALAAAFFVSISPFVINEPTISPNASMTALVVATVMVTTRTCSERRHARRMWASNEPGRGERSMAAAR